MGKNGMKHWLAGGVLCVLACGACVGAGAQAAAPQAKAGAAQSATVSAAAPAATAPVAGDGQGAAKPGSMGHEGIKVHGYWVLQVKNADGTLGKRVEFENSLVAGSGVNSTSGDQLLAGLISGNITPGGIAVGFIKGPVSAAGTDPSSYCNVPLLNQPAVPAGITCYSFVPSSSAFTTNTFVALNSTNQVTGLAETVSFSPSVAIVLTGNYVVPSGLTEIDGVQSYVSYCFYGNNSQNKYRPTGSGLAFGTETLPPSTCTAGPLPTGSVDVGFGALTSFIGSPLPLTNLSSGQVVQVTVTLSFS